MNQPNVLLEASIACLAGVETNPEILVFPKSSGKDTVRPRQKKHDVLLKDIRTDQHQINVDEYGFELIAHHTSVGDLFDNELVTKYYYPEMARFLKQRLGAKDVLVFDHNQRSKPRADRGDTGMRYPVESAHVDYTHASGAKRAQDILEDTGNTQFAKNHLALINIWRPIIGPVEDMPLAVCSGKTVSDEDLIETSIKHFTEKNPTSANHTGSIYSLKYNRRHEWYYVSRMMPSEVLLLKNWHSKLGTGVFNSPHTGFCNPRASSKCSPRESIEIRTLVIY